eukprot:403370847
MSETCSECSNQFDLKTRRPILLECGCTYCLKCVSVQLVDNPHRVIHCPLHDQDSTMAQALKENKHILTKLSALDCISILCDDHLNQQATQYCEFTVNASGLFDEYSVKNIKSQLELFSNNSRKIQSSEFQYLINKVERMLGNVVSKEERKQIDLVSHLGEQSQGSIITEVEKALINSKIDLQRMIDLSQTQLNDNLKSALDSFRDKYDKTVQELKCHIQYDLSENTKSYNNMGKKVINLKNFTTQQLKQMNQSIGIITANQNQQVKNIQDIQQQLKQTYDQEIEELEQKLVSKQMQRLINKQTFENIKRTISFLNNGQLLVENKNDMEQAEELFQRSFQEDSIIKNSSEPYMVNGLLNIEEFGQSHINQGQQQQDNQNDDLKEDQGWPCIIYS